MMNRLVRNAIRARRNLFLHISYPRNRNKGPGLTGWNSNTLHHPPADLFTIFNPSSLAIPDIHRTCPCRYCQSPSFTFTPRNHLDWIRKDQAGNVVQIGSLWGLFRVEGMNVDDIRTWLWSYTDQRALGIEWDVGYAGA
jgi:hypothetical protein